MSDAVGFAFLSGSLIGFIVGFVLAAKLSKDVLKDRADKGNIDIAGTTYKLVEINP